MSYPLWYIRGMKKTKKKKTEIQTPSINLFVWLIQQIICGTIAIALVMLIVWLTQ